MPLPTLATARLVLRPFTLSDAPDVMRMAGAPEVARTTLLIPHPYEPGMAESWIGSHPSSFVLREQVNFAIVLREPGTLCGAIALALSERDRNAELGYWIGRDYWGRGICTEAAREVVRYSFEELKLHRVYAGHFASNPASGRVLERVGMQREGCLRQHHIKCGEYEDRIEFGMLADEWRGFKASVSF